MMTVFPGTALGRLWPVLLCIGLYMTTTIVFAQSKASIPGDYPDPTVIYADGEYYSIGTSSEWGPHFPIYSSKDLVHWEQRGFLFSKTPDWAQSSFWAAEYFYHKGLYYVYYSAKRKSDGVSCIGVATSKYPDRDFVDQGIVVDYGTESIDAFVVREGNDLYMTWKAYGLDERPIELIGSKLSADGFHLEGEPFSLLMDTARVGIEGQSFVKKDDYYYMFYSAGACCGINCDYHVQAVRSKSIKGPYERVGAPVLLGETRDWKCMGHGTFVAGKDNVLYYLFHGYSKKGTTYTGREGLLARLDWNEAGAPQLTYLPAAEHDAQAEIVVDFKGEQPDPVFWQWDFRHATPVLTKDGAGLSLSGTYTADNPTGIAVTLRPSTLVYAITATLDQSNSSTAAQKGLVIYGDKERSIGLSIAGEELVFWRILDGKRTVLQTTQIHKTDEPLELKLALETGLRCHAYWKQGENWNELRPQAEAGTKVAGLSPWDRSPRPGLFFKGKESERAVFTRASFSQ